MSNELLQKRKPSQAQEEASLEQLCNQMKKVVVNESGGKFISKMKHKLAHKERQKKKAQLDSQNIKQIQEIEQELDDEQLFNQSSIKANSESLSWVNDEFLEEINKLNMVCDIFD